MSLTREDAQLRDRLQQTRRNDAAHERLMVQTAKAAGADLANIRRMSMKDKDRALSDMFGRAKGDAQ